MKRALLLLVLAACEKAGGAHVHASPARVGDRIAYHVRFDSHVTALDGRDHGGHAESSLILEVLAVTAGHPDRMRITVDRDDHVFDGKPTPSLTGTYELTAAGELSHPSGKPLTDYDRAFFRGWHIATDLSTIAGHEFHAGDTYRPSADEAIALGMPDAKDPWVLRVQRADDTTIVLTGEFQPPDAPPQLDSRTTTTVTLTATSETHVDDLVLRYQGKDVGGAHQTYVLSPQR